MLVWGVVDLAALSTWCAAKSVAFRLNLYLYLTLRRYTAASSRAVVLRQCIQLPMPLWRECLTLMGGKHAEAARG